MRLRFALTALLLTAVPGTVVAQVPAAPKPPQLTKAQVEDVAFQMRVLVSALQSDKVDAQAKEALSQCIYSNPFSKISEAMNKVAADNVGKMDKRNADQTLFVMVRVCGYDPQKAVAAGAAKPGVAPAAKPAAQPAKPVSKPVAKPASAPAKPAAKAPQGR